MALLEIQVPDIGDFKEVSVIELLAKPGDTIQAEQSLITVESDKASMEIPSSHAGVLKELRVTLGDKVKQGSVIAVLETAEASAAPAKTAAAPVHPAAPVMVTGQANQSSLPLGEVAPPATPAKTANGGLVEVRVPNIGDFKDVAIIEVFVKAGDTIQAEQSLITVESDKASVEIPSSHSGVVKEMRVKLGDKINEGDLLLMLETATAAPSAASPPVSAASGGSGGGGATVVSSAVTSAAAGTGSGTVASSTAATPSSTPKPSQVSSGTAPEGGLPHASPSLRKLAREMGVPLAEVGGSGPNGRITLEDLQNFSRAVMAGQRQTQAQSQAGVGGGGGEGLGLIPWPQVDFAQFGPVERQPLSRIQKISGANLHRNWVRIPHVTNHDDADITELEAFRLVLNKENEKAGLKLSVLAFLVKACVAALQKFPQFNASLDGDDLVFKRYYAIGFAADTPKGLMVPVIKEADKKGVLQIAQEMGELAKKAREGKLSPAEMTGASFTISSLGGIGGRYFTPIINAPEVAILGVCKGQQTPVWDDKRQQFVPRLMLPLSLSWDHRVIDGAAAARFNAYLGQVLSDMRRVLL